MSIITGGNRVRGSIGRANLAVALIAGGAAGAHTVTGIDTSDQLVAVLHNTAGVLADLTDEFTVSDADEIDNTGGTDTTGDQLLVFYSARG